MEGDDKAIFNTKKEERFMALALWCFQEESTMQPIMHKATQMLDGAVQIDPHTPGSLFLH